MRKFETKPTLREAFICDFRNETKDELVGYLDMIQDVCNLRGDALESLYQLAYRGPVRDGDLVSKSGRNQLLDCGAAAKIVVGGEDGYQACTYKGQRMLAVLFALGRGKDLMEAALHGPTPLHPPLKAVD